MNVLRGISNNIRGVKFIEDNIKLLIIQNFKDIIIDPFRSEEFEIAYSNFKQDVCTIKGFNFYVHNSYMYSNDIGITIVVIIKNEITMRDYKFSTMLRKW